MWSHARLLRGTLLLLSLLTLSRVQQPDQPVGGGWTAAWLLPVLLNLLLTAGCVAAAVQAGSALERIFSVLISTAMLHGLLLLLYFLRYRGRLWAVLRRLASLERSSATLRRPGELTTVYAQLAVFLSINLITFGMTLGQFFSSSPLQHPNYLNPLVVPAALQTPAWYLVITSLQFLQNVFVTAVTAAFDLLVLGLADAMTLLLERLTRQVSVGDNSVGQRSADDEETTWQDRVEDGMAGDKVFLDSQEAGVNIRKSTDRSDTLHENNTISMRAPVVVSARIRPVLVNVTPAALTSPTAETRLRRLVAAHREVDRLASDAADFCSLPLLCLYTSVTIILLLDVYNTIARLSSGLSSFSVSLAFVALMLLRLLMVSCAGSRLIRQGELLHAALADAGWSEGDLPPSARLSLQLLLERTRRPAAFHGWGLFTAHKATMLSMLGFVLTYTVILMQMVYLK